MDQIGSSTNISINVQEGSKHQSSVMPLMIRLEVILGLGTLPFLSLPFYVSIAPFNNTGQNTKTKTQNSKVKSLRHKTQNILTQNTMSLIGFRSDVMKMTHDHFGNLRRISRMTTERYGKSNTKRRSYRKSIEFVDFLEVSRYKELYLLDIN